MNCRTPQRVEDDQVLESSWQRAWATLGLLPPRDVFVDLLQRYCEPHRHYHTLQHLRECIDLLEPQIARTERPGEVELALWFHDAVYNTHANDNESRSAALASSVLIEHGAPSEVVWRVREMILATGHQQEPQGHDAKVLVDLDLGILAASPERFAQYQAQIRAEYEWVPDEAYRVGRREVLQSFARRPAIYTYAGRSMEEHARRNLAFALMQTFEEGASPGQSIPPKSSEKHDGSSAPESSIPSMQVGARLWWVGMSHKHEEHEVAIKAVDGRWAVLSNGVQLDLATMCAVPDPICRGRCYASQDAHTASQRMIEAWADFGRDIACSQRPDGLRIEEIDELRVRWGIQNHRKPREH